MSSKWLTGDVLQAIVLSPLNGILMDVNQIFHTNIRKVGSFEETRQAKTAENVAQGVIMVALVNILIPPAGVIGLVISAAIIVVKIKNLISFWS
jgi:hypothetical protein